MANTCNPNHLPTSARQTTNAIPNDFLCQLHVTGFCAGTCRLTSDLAQPPCSPTESNAFAKSSNDSFYSAKYQQADIGCVPEWLQPAETNLNTYTYIEPYALDRTNQFANFGLPAGSPLGPNLSISSVRSEAPEPCDIGGFSPSNYSLPETPVDDYVLPVQVEPVPLEPQSKQPIKKKRGRPRLVQPGRISSGSKRNPRVSTRLPHKQVERKYRQGLNNEFDRLRLAIPSLPHWEPHSMNGPPKPSKATVLASAIDYIRRMEVERDDLLQENEILHTTYSMPDLKNGQT